MFPFLVGTTTERTGGTFTNLQAGWLYIETDGKVIYRWNGTSWDLIGQLSGTLGVAAGGTGATTLTGILKGSGTSAFTAVTAPSGVIVGDTDPITLSGKTLTTPIINGLIGANVAKTANYTLTATDTVITADASGGAFTLTLPTAVGAKAIYIIKRTDILASTNLIIIATTSSQTIDGATNNYLWNGQTVVLQSDNTNWQVLARGPNSQYFRKGSTFNNRYVFGAAYPSPVIATTSTTLPAIDTLWALPMILTQTTKFDTITFRVTTNSTAGGVARVGIYRDNGNMYPGALIFDSGSIATDSGTVKDTTITSGLQIFPPGMYWGAIVFGTAAPQTKVFNTIPGMISLGFDSGLSGNTSGYGYSVAHAFAALPDPYTASATLLTSSPSATVPVPQVGLRPI